MQDVIIRLATEFVVLMVYPMLNGFYKIATCHSDK
jgi:hypothetical protein